MTQSHHPFGTRRSNSSKRSAEVYFNLEEIEIGGDCFLTELTWSYQISGMNFEQHYAVRHPGSAETDAALRQLSPDYQPPHRWSAIVVSKAFLTDYEALEPGTPIYGVTIDQCLALEDYISRVPDVTEGFFQNIRLLDQVYGSDMVRGIKESLQGIRDKSIRRAS
jgi:hypothetical protein